MSGVRGKSGKKHNQRMKHYFVLQYLLKNTDENHFETATDIVEHLKEFGIESERRSIYKDIQEINIVNIMLENECSFEEAKEILEDNPSLSTIQYKHRNGFYVARHPISQQNARLLAECVYTARFVSKSKTKELVGEIGGLLSNHYKNDINHDAFIVDRVRVNSDSLFDSIDIIQRAMAKREGNKLHVPEKIGFQYLKYTLQSTSPKLVERRNGIYYVVSPFAIIIHEGNYYLLGVKANSKNKHLSTYRIDRMRNVRLLNEPREQAEETKDIDSHLETYLQRVFNMYGGKRERVYIQFISSLLDTMVDRFETENASYFKVDDNHIKVSVEVEISPTFFGWLAGFGKKAVLLSPDNVREEYKKHLTDIITKYET